MSTHENFCKGIVVSLFWWQQQKTKECTSIGCFAKFLFGVWNFSLYKFSDCLEKRFYHCSLSYQSFRHQILCIHCLLHPPTACFTHNQIFSFGRSQGTFGVQTPVTLGGKRFQLSTQQCAVCCCHCCERVAMSGSNFPCPMEIPFFFKVLDMKHWSSLNFLASWSVDSPFGCPLRQFKGASSLPSICICHFPTACLSFNFPSSS